MIQYTIIILFSCFLFFASYKIYKKNVGLDLNNTTKIVGRITKAFTTTRQTGGQGQKNIPVFAFNLDNLEQTLGAYRPSRNYSELLENLKIGDTVTVYYKPLSSNPIDINVYQIEKNGQIILDYKSYSQNYSLFSIAIGILGFVVLFFGVYKIRRKNIAAGIGL